MTIAVFSPEDGIPAASIGYPGQIAVSAAINKLGVFIANNEAPVIKGDKIDFNAANILAAQLLFVMRSSDLGDLDRFIRSFRTNCPVIVSACDTASALTYEWTASEIKLRPETGAGFIAVTNHFTGPSWGRPAPGHDEYGMTRTRLANLISMGETLKGRLDVDRIQGLLDTGIGDGGATDRERTILQIAASPGEMRFRMKVPGFQDWTEIDLKGAFGGRDYDYTVKRQAGTL